MELMEPNSITSCRRLRSTVRATEFHFRQDSDLLYLSGFAEPESVLVLIPEREHGEFVMFGRERNREREIWDGYRAAPKG